jgi:hypothetical protein
MILIEDGEMSQLSSPYFHSVDGHEEFFRRASRERGVERHARAVSDVVPLAPRPWSLGQTVFGEVAKEVPSKQGFHVMRCVCCATQSLLQPNSLYCGGSSMCKFAQYICKVVERRPVVSNQPSGSPSSSHHWSTASHLPVSILQ